MARTSDKSTVVAPAGIKTGGSYVLAIPIPLEVRVLDHAGVPMKDTPCRLEFSDGAKAEVTTDGTGWLKVNFCGAPEFLRISPLIDAPGEDRAVFLDLPESTLETRASQRLHNLGFSPEADMPGAVHDFQEFFELELTGELDDQFEEQLDEIYQKFGDHEETQDDQEDPPDVTGDRT